SPIQKLKALFFPKHTKTQRFQALNTISLTIEKGETFGIIGTNGSGKSTLLQIISGILKPDVHYISLEKDFSNFAEVVNKIQDNAYLERITHNAFQDLIASGNYDQKQLGITTMQYLKPLITAQQNDINTTQHLQQLKKRLRLLNYTYCLLAEVKFIFAKFYLLLTDPSYQGWNKITLLTNGVKRYTTYVTARWSKAK
ncbi:MAG: ATP-binding cassette domain-containing protein, partial [Gammaproteobacteria bacterium]